MSMSRDRVRFKLDVQGGCSATRRAYIKAFGQNPPIGFGLGGAPCIKTIICRPSQFARFLIYRNQEGGRNSFKLLEPELFTPTPEESPIDVSTNPRKEC